jgi:hypothetical protein
MMQDLSALTPPLLMGLAVLVAIGAFLRHEIGRKRPDEDALSADTPDDRPFPADQSGGVAGASPSHGSGDS